MIPKRSIVLLIAATLLAPAAASFASRCQYDGSVSSGLHCTCPDFQALLADPTSHVDCPPGWTPVVYNIDPNVPFAGDGSTSHATTYGMEDTECAGLVHDSPLRGQWVVCWGPLDQRGCRRVKMADDGVCLRIDEVPVSSTQTTGLVAVANAGASFRMCPPVDPATSCKATRASQKDNPKFWLGGLCTTMGCTADTIDADACNAGWGANYWGYVPAYRGPDPVDVPPNWYDYPSGQFKIVNEHSHMNCGQVASCLGRRGKHVYRLQAVLVPAPGYKPPCLPNNPCGPADCFQ